MQTKPGIVIVGAGFGGLFAARGLAHTQADITLIDQHNYHLFQPLLYQVATAGLAPSDIAWPIRSILSKQRNVTVLLDEVTDVDREKNLVITQNRSIPFNYLILATGARHAYFGHPEWEQHAPGLKSIEDARSIRHRILMAFEQAEMTQDDSERQRLTTFVVVGAGPTGVELAGTIAELARWTLAADFRHIDPRNARVILLEAGNRVLPSMPEKLSAYAKKSLEKLGVDVRLGKAVTDCDAEGVVVGGERLSSATVLWAAGVAASPAAVWLGCPADNAGRVMVKQDLSIEGKPNVFTIGDTAAVKDSAGNAVPGIAPAAKQQGRFVANLIHARISGLKQPAKFNYRHTGNLATIGRKSAVIEFPFLQLSGFLAWWIWGIAHVYFLIGVRSPILVAMNWLRQYVTYGRGARLITSRQKNQPDNSSTDDDSSAGG
ncbi:MAG: NADH dehydrogenase [Candidatus Azotimanducaceae bacterium]|jgi:NADH dehydrogenase